MTTNAIYIDKYVQDVDSFGWCINALFHVKYSDQENFSYGVLSILTGTHKGANFEKPGGGKRCQDEVVRENWHLIDWYASKEDATQAYNEALSRVW